jgi:serine/threonine protein kinase
MLLLMGSRAADSPPELQGSASKKVPAETLELVDADIDQAPVIDELGIHPGTILADKYLIEREIGRGGIGVIVAARHLQLDQHVAIKYLQRKVLDNRTIIERFAREARLAAKIKSDHVVRVHDVSSHPDLGPYIVMEYLEGTDLGHLVEAGPLPIAAAVDYVIQACDALAEAHVLGIVHRDLKPDNLFLAKRAAGTSIVKILDFGISKSVPTQRMSGGWSHVTTATETFGTPVYMSPEQLRSSASVDARSDIWSLGVVLFELLTANVPFAGESVAQLCTSILSDPPSSLLALRPHAPPELEATILRCLEKNPAKRFRNVAELAQELGRFCPAEADSKVRHITRVLEESGSSVRPPTPMPGTYSIGEARAMLEAARGDVPAPKLPVAEEARQESVPVLPIRRRGPVILVAAAMALIAVVGVMATMRSSTATAPALASAPAPASASASASALASASAPASALASASAPALASASAPAPALASASALTSAPAPAPPRASAKPPPQPVVQTVPPVLSIAPPVAKPAPEPPPKPVKKDDYSQFGGRP